jgi:hypothetical protein
VSEPSTPVEPVETKPLLRIVRGDATPEEIAALVAVIASMGAIAPAKAKPRSTWAHPARGHREFHRHSASAWRASGLPR